MYACNGRLQRWLKEIFLTHPLEYKCYCVIDLLWCSHTGPQMYMPTCTLTSGLRRSQWRGSSARHSCGRQAGPSEWTTRRKRCTLTCFVCVISSMYLTTSQATSLVAWRTSGGSRVTRTPAMVRCWTEAPRCSLRAPRLILTQVTELDFHFLECLWSESEKSFIQSSNLSYDFLSMSYRSR
jgi:hypothetical protein